MDMMEKLKPSWNSGNTLAVDLQLSIKVFGTDVCPKNFYRELQVYS
jgi:hypothetical protein